MDALPSGLPQHFATAIHAGLLRIHARKLEGVALDVCLREAYDVFADALREDGGILTDEVLREQIPAWVFHWAVAKRWTPYPPLVHSGRSPAFVLGDPRPRPPAYVPVPEHKLNVQFGEYKITDWYKSDFIGRLESRIAYWQAEVLMPAAQPLLAETRPTPDLLAWRMAARAIAMDAEVHERAKLESQRAQAPAQTSDTNNTPPPQATESIGTQLDRLRQQCHWSIEELAEAIGLDPTNVSRHLSDTSAPRPKNLRKYIAAFSKQLKTPIVIRRNAAKRS